MYVLPTALVAGTQRLVYGPAGLPVEQVGADGKPLYFVHDHVGSTLALLDSDGGLAGSFAYGPFGAVTKRAGTANTDIRFAGGYQDPTGLLYLANRYLDPRTGVFLTVDPALPFTGDPYGYAAGDPMNASDPTGQWPTAVIGAIIGAAVATGTNSVGYLVTNYDDLSLRGAFGGITGGLVSGAITGGCMGAGGVLAGPAGMVACGTIGGAAADIVNQAVSNGHIEWIHVGVAAAVGAGSSAIGLANVGPEIRSSWLSFTNRIHGGLKPSNLWKPGRLAQRMYKQAGWGDASGFAIGTPADWVYQELMCGW